jgi:hypothetical protein
MVRTVKARTTSVGLGEGVHRMSILLASSDEEITEGHGGSRYLKTDGGCQARDLSAQPAARSKRLEVLAEVRCHVLKRTRYLQR